MATEVDFRDKLDEMEKAFKSMPSYMGGCIAAEDFSLLGKAMGYERTEEEIQTTIKYWMEHHNGKLELKQFLGLVSQAHDTSELGREYALLADKDKNGFIDSAEFVDIATLMQTHDARLKGKSFDDFVNEADTNLDGKVSIDECVIWIRKNLHNENK